MNWGNVLAYILVAEQVAIAVAYFLQGVPWKGVNFLLGAGIVYTVTRM